jgi:transposase InsO family protein
MPFGLCNAPASFERLMEQVLADVQWEHCLVYLDDILVAQNTVKRTIESLEKVLTRLRSAGLKLKPSKCTLFAKKVRYLGHIISEEGIACDPEKVSCVKEWPIPRSVRDVRSFLGLAGYYRDHIGSFAAVAEPLFFLTRKNVRFEWTEACQIAFDALKEALSEAPVLVYPDPTKDYILDTDCSLYGMGAVLSQIIEGKERVIAYASKSLNKAQRNYCTTRRELLAVITFVKHFRHYLYGTKFLIRTDHASLRWLTNFRDPEGILARWLTTLETYNYEIQHRSGKDHANADSLSRCPPRLCPRTDCDDCSQGRKAKEPEKLASPPKAFVSVISPAQRAGTQTEPDSLVDVAAILSFTAMSWEELAQSQKEDLEIGPIYQWKVEQRERPPTSEIDGYGTGVRTLWGQWDLLELDQGVLCRKITLGPNTPVKQIVLPAGLRRVLMKELHDAPLGGHRGIKKTLQGVQSRVYWPGQRNDVRRWVQTCPVCQKVKSGNVKRKYPLQQRRPGYPLERVAMDIIGPINPPTKRGNSYILVVEDYFSKYVEAYPLREHTAQTVADVYVTEWVSRYGVGKELHTDQAPEFESRLFAEIMRLLGVKKTRTTPYRPQSDGSVERVNRTLKALLSAYVDRDYESWDEYLPFVLLSYRSSVHESTGCTPSLLFNNRECNLPADFFFGPPDGPEIPSCPYDYVEWLRDAGRRAHAFVQERVKGALVRQKRNYDRSSVVRTFQPGDLVYREYIPQSKEHKFASPWKGPYRVLEKMGDVTYKVQPVSGGRSVVVHIDHLKQCLTRRDDEHQESPVPDDPEPDDPEPEGPPGNAESVLGEEETPQEGEEQVSPNSPEPQVSSPDPVSGEEPPSPLVKCTRSGRRVRPPVKLDLLVTWV